MEKLNENTKIIIRAMARYEPELSQDETRSICQFCGEIANADAAKFEHSAECSVTLARQKLEEVRTFTVRTCQALSHILGAVVYPDHYRENRELMGSLTAGSISQFFEAGDPGAKEVWAFLKERHHWMYEVTMEQIKDPAWRNGTLVELLKQHGDSFPVEVKVI